MEESVAKSRSKIFRILPKATRAAVLLFQNPHFSPGQDKRPDVNSHKLKLQGSSGPVMSMIPAEARRKSKNIETEEPGSPKISCMGQIKHKNKQAYKPEKISKSRPTGRGPELKMPLGINKVFRSGRKSDAYINEGKPPLLDRAPSLSQTMRFANFDWTSAQIAPEKDRGFYYDEDRNYNDVENDAITHFPAPIMVAGFCVHLEPRNELNLWKRRNTAQLKPLQLNMV